MLVGKSNFRVVLPYSIFLFFIFTVLVFSSLPFGKKEVVAAEAAATKTTPVTKKFYDEKKFKEFQENLDSYDTDKDGIKDVDELLIYKTNPGIKDSDKDGFSDGDEIKGGYNPLGSGKMTAEMINANKERKKDHVKLINALDLMYCNNLNIIFTIHEKKLKNGDIKNIVPLYTLEEIKKEANGSPEEKVRMEKNYSEIIDYVWADKISQRNALKTKNINKYCPDLRKKAWQQIEMIVDQECSGYYYDEWLQITQRKKPDFPVYEFAHESSGDIFRQGLEETCPNHQKNIEVAKKNKINIFKKINKYDSITLLSSYKNDLIYSGTIGSERYLVNAKSGKKELVPKKYQNSEIKIEGNNIIIRPSYKNNEWFLYENGKVGKLLYKDDIPLELEANYDQSLKIKNGSIISHKDNANHRYEKTDLIKDSKPYKTISGNVTSLITYKDTFLAYSDKGLYLDSKDAFLFDGFFIEDKLIKDDIIYALAYKITDNELTDNELEKTYYLLSFDGKTEKKVKEFDYGLVVSKMTTLKDELAFAYYDTKYKGGGKCSKTMAKKLFHCLTFLNPEKFKELNNIEIYGDLPWKLNAFSNKNNTVIQTSQNSFNINGQEKKYDTDQAVLKNFGNNYGICHRSNKDNLLVCAINGKDYIHVNSAYFNIGDKDLFGYSEYLNYDNKSFYVNDVNNKNDKNIEEQALFADGKEVARCKKIKMVYVDKKEKGVVYYTCQYDQSQGGGEALKKITIK